MIEKEQNRYRAIQADYFVFRDFGQIRRILSRTFQDFASFCHPCRTEIISENLKDLGTHLIDNKC